MRTAMHAIRFLFAASVIAIPQSAIAAGIAISCALTKEDIFFVSGAPPDEPSARKDLAETANFTIADSMVVTAMASPCDRITGGITRVKIDVTCSFPADKNNRASIRIQIDRQLGTISETWDIIEFDGGKFRYNLDGTCTMARIG
jgi:hypothetical protein